MDSQIYINSWLFIMDQFPFENLSTYLNIVLFIPTDP